MFGIPPAESRTAASGGPYDLDMPRLQAKFWVMLTMFIGFLWMIWRMIRQVINAKKREAKFPNGFTADPSLPAELRSKAPVAAGGWTILFLSVIGIGFIAIVGMM